MAKISTYPVDSNVSVNDMVIGTDAQDMNMTKNYTVSGLASTINSLNQSTLRLSGEETTNQGLVVLDAAYQIKFGPAQGTVSTAVMLDVLGNITFNQAGAYYVRFFGNFEMKTPPLPGNGLVYFRSLINGVQFGSTRLIELDTIGLSTPMESSLFINAAANDVVTFEMFLSSVGAQAGGLYASTVPVLWSNVPSSSVDVWQIN